jgi:fluoride ion exporter CrcB/FEX
MTMIGTGACVFLTTCSGWNVEISSLSARLGITRMIFDTCPANLSKLVADVGKKFGNTT